MTGLAMHGDMKTAGRRCRPGDLAIVTKCKIPERLGIMVRVVEPCIDGRYDWLVELLGPGIMAPGVMTGILMKRTRALLRDCSLTPIKGEANPYQMARPDLEASEVSE